MDALAAPRAAAAQAPTQAKDCACDPVQQDLPSADTFGGGSRASAMPALSDALSAAMDGLRALLDQLRTLIEQLTTQLASINGSGPNITLPGPVRDTGLPVPQPVIDGPPFPPSSEEAVAELNEHVRLRNEDPITWMVRDTMDNISGRSSFESSGFLSDLLRRFHEQVTTPAERAALEREISRIVGTMVDDDNRAGPPSTGWTSAARFQLALEVHAGRMDQQTFQRITAEVDRIDASTRQRELEFQQRGEALIEQLKQQGVSPAAAEEHPALTRLFNEYHTYLREHADAMKTLSDIIDGHARLDDDRLERLTSSVTWLVDEGDSSGLSSLQQELRR